jgi:hypothetical protein
MNVKLRYETRNPIYQPTVICGENLLAVHEYYNQRDSFDVAYRGSPRLEAEIEPKLTAWYRDGRVYPDSDVPVVCADRLPLAPLFMALAPRNGLQFGYKGNQEGGVTYALMKSSRAEFQKSVGYVAVMDGADFIEYAGLPVPAGWPGADVSRVAELRSRTGQAVQYAFRVTYDDFESFLNEAAGSQLEYRDQW